MPMLWIFQWIHYNRIIKVLYKTLLQNNIYTKQIFIRVTVGKIEFYRYLTNLQFAYTNL
jgi:hypothetical protein